MHYNIRQTSQFPKTDCSICLEELGDPADRKGTMEARTLIDKTHCGHYFHDICLQDHIQSQLTRKTPPNCPLCRSRFTEIKIAQPKPQPAAEICTICLDEVTVRPDEDRRTGPVKTTALRCNHIFHEWCINKWIFEGQNKNCPNCRDPIMTVQPKTPTPPVVNTIDDSPDVFEHLVKGVGAMARGAWWLVSGIPGAIDNLMSVEVPKGMDAVRQKVPALQNKLSKQKEWIDVLHARISSISGQRFGFSSVLQIKDLKEDLNEQLDSLDQEMKKVDQLLSSLEHALDNLA